MDIKNVVVAGGGVLGSQIAFQSAFKGFNVTVWVRSDASIDRAKPKFERLKGIYLQTLEAMKTNPAAYCRGLATSAKMTDEEIDATGQECYTLAMELSDCQTTGTLQIPFSILGTDLSETAVSAAQRGVYGSADYARLPHSWQMRYCGDFQNGEFHVKESLREAVSFQRQNLMALPHQSSVYDLIFCRNVLIYFQDADRIKLIAKLTDALTPGGYLMIGHTETLLSISNSLQYIEPAIYRKPEASA